jgi:DNA helicase II / ATP-dependent DNA helicase PcrA
MFELSPEKRRVVETEGHILILGGPGSGKTTIALIKADSAIGRVAIGKHQRVLFLSFARATVARVREAADECVTAANLRSIEISTYHGFAWKLLRSHGYLINGRTTPRLISPPDASARLAGIGDATARKTEIRRMFQEEGVLHFDLFAQLAGDLLHSSATLRRIVSAAYPIIILDEFQDTDAAEWRMIRALGTSSCLIALADPDQRIYEFRGADPLRIDAFITTYSPAQFDFGLENNRSGGTDIVSFGNDLIAGANIGKTYSDVEVASYRVLKAASSHIDLKLTVLQTVTRLHAAQPSDWSLAILVPTNQLMMDVSDYLTITHKLKSGRSLAAVSHTVAFDSAGPSLAAAVIASTLEGGTDVSEVTKRILLLLREHIRGRKGGDTPGQQQLELAKFLTQYVATGKMRGSARKALIDDCLRIAAQTVAYKFVGDPGDDWIAVRKLFEESACEALATIARDAKYLRLLHKGSALRSRLNALWRSKGSYLGATSAVRDALLQEHLFSGAKDWKGVHVMTIHKSKGKEFDEVIIYEGRYQHRIVNENASVERVTQARRNLRVAVTRAKKRTTILTPHGNGRCLLL